MKCPPCAFLGWPGARFNARAIRWPLFFPAPCRICEATLDTASRIPICPECLDSLRPLEGPMCQLCGRLFVSPMMALVPQPLCHGSSS